MGLKGKIKLMFLRQIMHNFAWFFHENVPIILYQLTKFQCHIFLPSRDIKQNVLLSSYLDKCWCHKLQDLYWVILWDNGWQGKIEGNLEICNLNILPLFYNYLKVRNNFWWKMLFISLQQLFSFSRYLSFCLDFFVM